GLARVWGGPGPRGGTLAARRPGAGGGSELAVRCPARPDGPVEARGAAEEPPRAAGPPRRVLVVDDNVDAADSAALLLRHLGHTVAVAYHGPAALEAVAAFRPEVVLLDIRLPGLSGHELARAP